MNRFVQAYPASNCSHLLHRIATQAVFAIALLFAVMPYSTVVSADLSSRPNIVLILADDEDSCMSLLYYFEHEPLRQNRITVVSRAGNRFRLRWTAMTKDINYYDGSKPPTQVEIEGEFLFKDIGKWIRA